MKSQGAGDALARTAAVNALTVGQVFFLLNSRFKTESSLSLAAHKGNRYLPMGIGAVVGAAIAVHLCAAAPGHLRHRTIAAVALAPSAARRGLLSSFSWRAEESVHPFPAHGASGARAGVTSRSLAAALARRGPPSRQQASQVEEKGDPQQGRSQEQPAGL